MSQLVLAIDENYANRVANMKRTARELQNEGLAIAKIRRQINEQYSTCIQDRHVRLWVNPKPARPKSLVAQCADAINSGEICFGEAIDWLVERGMNEDKAFDWAMQRFTGSYSNESSATIIDARSFPKGRSRQRKAA